MCQVFVFFYLHYTKKRPAAYTCLVLSCFLGFFFHRTTWFTIMSFVKSEVRQNNNKQAFTATQLAQAHKYYMLEPRPCGWNTGYLSSTQTPQEVKQQPVQFGQQWKVPASRTSLSATSSNQTKSGSQHFFMAGATWCPFCKKANTAQKKQNLESQITTVWCDKPGNVNHPVCVATSQAKRGFPSYYKRGDRGYSFVKSGFRDTPQMFDFLNA